MAYDVHSQADGRVLINLDDGPHNEPCDIATKRINPYSVRFLISYLRPEEEYQQDLYIYGQGPESLCFNSEHNRYSCHTEKFRDS